MNAPFARDETIAPPAYQAEVLRGQICDDINRRFWIARRRLMSEFEDHKQLIQRDHEKFPADQFLAKYDDWKFL